MYYVIYTGGGREKVAEDMIMKFVPNELFDGCFHPVRIMRRKRNGRMVELYQCLVPGYIFLMTDHITDIYRELRSVPMLTKLMGQLKDAKGNPVQGVVKPERYGVNTTGGHSASGEEKSYPDEILPPDIIPLSNDEVDWLLQLVADTPNRYGPIYAGISHIGFDENDQVQILDGPLASMLGRVRKINLHKRYAEVEINFLGQKNILHMGIDILARE